MAAPHYVAGIDFNPKVRKDAYDVMGRLVEFMSSFTPRTLAYAGTAAALALVVKAAVLT